MKPDLDKIHSISTINYAGKVQIRFKTKKYPEFTFEVTFEEGEIKRSSFEKVRDVDVTKRKFNSVDKWMNETVGRLEHFFLNECNETKLLLLIACGSEKVRK